MTQVISSYKSEVAFQANPARAQSITLKKSISRPRAKQPVHFCAHSKHVDLTVDCADRPPSYQIESLNFRR